MSLSWKSCLRIGTTAVLIYLCIHYFGSVQTLLLKALSACAPVIAGSIVAYIINIVMSFYEKHYFPTTKKRFLIKSRRLICMIFAFISLFAIIALIFSLIIPELVDCINLVISQVPKAIEISVKWLQKNNLATEAVVDELSKINWNDKIENIVSTTFNYFGNAVTLISTVISAVFSSIFNTIFALIFAVIILFSKDKLIYQSSLLLKTYAKSSISGKLSYVLGVFNDSFHKYIVGQCTEAVILGLLCTIGMLILRLPYATMIGALVAFTALVPIVGAFIGGAVGAFTIAMVDPIKALIFIVFLVILQQLEGNIIYPKVVGTSVGLPALWVLVSITIGGATGGILGMLICVPIGASLYKIVKQDVKNRNIKNEEQESSKA